MNWKKKINRNRNAILGIMFALIVVTIGFLVANKQLYTFLGTEMEITTEAIRWEYPERIWYNITIKIENFPPTLTEYGSETITVYCSKVRLVVAGNDPETGVHTQVSEFMSVDFTSKPDMYARPDFTVVFEFEESDVNYMLDDMKFSGMLESPRQNFGMRWFRPINGTIISLDTHTYGASGFVIESTVVIFVFVYLIFKRKRDGLL